MAGDRSYDFRHSVQGSGADGAGPVLPCAIRPCRQVAGSGTMGAGQRRRERVSGTGSEGSAYRRDPPRPEHYRDHRAYLLARVHDAQGRQQRDQARYWLRELSWWDAVFVAEERPG